MIVYSHKIIKFIHEIKSLVTRVLSQEIGLKVFGDRFYNRCLSTSYPIKIVIFNTNSLLGYFDPVFLELGFNECLMHGSREQIQNIIRHEIAHYINFVDHGDTIQDHGIEFRNFCKNLGWGEEVYKATCCLSLDEGENLKLESTILRKVKKLMALSASSNPHEAELAMLKSQQLLLKHNIDSKYLEDDEEEKFVLKRVMKQKRENSKMRSIATILETFFVNVVYKRISEGICIEVVGQSVNVEIADYVAAVLQTELDHLWNQAQRQNQLKGVVAKNSFFIGIAKGYCKKVAALKRDYPSETAQALMILEKKLVEAREIVYEKLKSSRSQQTFCKESLELGEKMGSKLNINAGIYNTSKKSNAWIGFNKA